MGFLLTDTGGRLLTEDGFGILLEGVPTVSPLPPVVVDPPESDVFDLILRHADTLEPLWVLPPHPTSGYLQVETSLRLWRPDTIEVQMDARTAAQAGVVEGRLLCVGDLVFAVEQVHIGSDEQSRVAGLATITGYCPSTTPRAILPPAGQSHLVQSNVPGETAMKFYVSASIGPTATAQRRWAPLAIEGDQGRGKVGTWRARYQQLSEYLELIGMQTGVGFRTVWHDGTPTFMVVAGVHRDRMLAVREGTVRAEELLSTIVDVRNVGIVGGQGEGAARQIIQRHIGVQEPSGLSRRETFVDARDTDSTATLRSRGDAKLAETAAPGTAELELQESESFRYGEHFGLGDTMRHKTEYGHDRQVRVVEVTSTWRESATPERTVILDRPWPDATERASGGTAFE